MNDERGPEETPFFPEDGPRGDTPGPDFDAAREQADEAISEPEVPETQAAWEDLDDQSLLGITDRISELVLFADDERDEYDAMEKLGADYSGLDLSATFSIRETQTIAVALHLVGFFSEKHGKTAVEILNRLRAERVRVENDMSDEQRQNLLAAEKKLETAQVAQMLGVDPEALASHTELGVELGAEPQPEN